MKKCFLLVLILGNLGAFAQDSSAYKVKRVFPAIQLGGNLTGSVKGEAGFLLGLTNHSQNQTYAMSMIMHGPSAGVEIGRYRSATRLAPKVSYEWYNSFIGVRTSLIDYMDDDLHNLYVAAEAGMSGGGIFNILAGASFPVSGDKLSEIPTFRLTINMNLLFFFFDGKK